MPSFGADFPESRHFGGEYALNGRSLNVRIEAYRPMGAGSSRCLRDMANARIVLVKSTGW